MLKDELIKAIQNMSEEELIELLCNADKDFYICPSNFNLSSNCYLTCGECWREAKYKE